MHTKNKIARTDNASYMREYRLRKKLQYKKNNTANSSDEEDKPADKSIRIRKFSKVTFCDKLRTGYYSREFVDYITDVVKSSDIDTVEVCDIEL